MRNLLTAALALVFSAGVAFAQDADKLAGTVKLVDLDKGKMLVALATNEGGIAGIKIVEYDLGKDVKFLDEKGKPLKGGLANPAFKSPNNRPAVPVSITFNKDGGVKGIRLTPPPK